MAAMEGLPGDAVLAILLKLAVQDPLSLLRATFACKWIFELTKTHPAMWREAFLAPYWEGMGAVRSEDLAELDARISASLGGYKKLALARARHWQAAKTGELRTNQFKKRMDFEQIKKRIGLLINTKKLFARIGALRPTTSVTKMYMTQFVYLHRLRGRLFCDIIMVPEEEVCHEIEGDPDLLLSVESPASATLDLEFNFTEFGKKLLGATYTEMIQDWEKLTAGADGSRRLVNDTLSVEIYASVHIFQGQVLAVTCTPRYNSTYFTPTCKDCEGVDHRFPDCRVPVYFVPQGTRGFSGQGSLKEEVFQAAEAESKVVHTSLR